LRCRQTADKQHYRNRVLVQEGREPLGVDVLVRRSVRGLKLQHCEGLNIGVSLQQVAMAQVDQDIVGADDLLNQLLPGWTAGKVERVLAAEDIHLHARPRAHLKDGVTNRGRWGDGIPKILGVRADDQDPQGPGPRARGNGCVADFRQLVDDGADALMEGERHAEGGWLHQLDGDVGQLEAELFVDRPAHAEDQTPGWGRDHGHAQ
jgi:hypothetical protein